ncbi:serine/threonine-protein kinase [Vallicoccus soli]|uniref:serine/threonine-protein kinase n=1 Tax=Vallicoccus soli TaxID=2339232 RepID=UPI001402D98F|nr:serine/threonine-protein kinase [Vallicoccus soli]
MQGRAPAVPGYEVLRPLGAGGTGEVWLAQDAATGERVALKRVQPALDGPAARARVRREAAVLAGLEHEHLVRLHALHTLPEGLVLVLGHAGGGTLADLVRRRGPLGPGKVVTVAAPVAQALAHVHAHGVVHGDVAPGNLLLTDDGRPLLADLGLARLLGEQGEVHGTEGFTDPAVVAGAEPTAAADVHALAAVCRWALGGALDAAPDALRAVLERALDPDPSARPHAGDLARALFDACPPEPVRLPARAAGAGEAPEGARVPADPSRAAPDGAPAAGGEPGGAGLGAPRPPGSLAALLRGPGPAAAAAPGAAPEGGAGRRWPAPGGGPTPVGADLLAGLRARGPAPGSASAGEPVTRRVRPAAPTAPVEDPPAGRFPGRALAAALAGAVCVGLVAGGVVLHRAQGGPAGAGPAAGAAAAAEVPAATPAATPSATPAATPAATTPTSPRSTPPGRPAERSAAAAAAGTDWAAVLQDLYARRSAAFAAASEVALRDVYAPGSPDLAEGEQQLAALRGAGVVAPDVRLRVLSAEPVPAGEAAAEAAAGRRGGVVLDVVDALAPWTLTDDAGTPLGRREGRAAQRVRVELVPGGTGWLIARTERA